ncbi:glycine cleavage system protein GcvH [Tumidithrix elongata RA019]|uniref:Glycine cleavage system H protein n=1 Tax=Tumidithrix elongata BACA0141 TaxID=2716417 RepID=A0AAW9PSW8_9CYAN|nr:glycine cleavage system protein GcvH [Tumidithrix elongata RA019]
MLEYPNDLKYTDSHEYIRLVGDVATVGVTAFAIDQLGDVVFIDLPEIGTTVTKGEPFGTVESVKAVEDLYAPVSGEVLEANFGLVDEPEKIAADPYGEAWLLKVKLADPSVLGDAMSADEYRSKVEGL